MRAVRAIPEWKAFTLVDATCLHPLRMICTLDAILARWDCIWIIRVWVGTGHAFEITFLLARRSGPSCNASALLTGLVELVPLSTLNTIVAVLGCYARTASLTNRQTGLR
jgi:hypothetical protein